MNTAFEVKQSMQEQGITFILHYCSLYATKKKFYYVRLLKFYYNRMISVKQDKEHLIPEPQAGNDILCVVSKAKPV